MEKLIKQQLNGRQEGASQNQIAHRKRSNDFSYWQSFADRFFSQSGVLRPKLIATGQAAAKQFEISNPALPRYYWTHFNSGVQNIQMFLENAKERDLPNGGHFVESKSCFIYWFANGHHVEQFCPFFYSFYANFCIASCKRLFARLFRPE